MNSEGKAQVQTCYYRTGGVEEAEGTEMNNDNQDIPARPINGLTNRVGGLVSIRPFPLRFLNVFSGDYLSLLRTMYLQFQTNTCWKIRI